MDTIRSTHLKLKRLFLNILSIFMIAAIALANTGFPVQAAQRSLPGDWDGRAVQKASVLFENGIYRMWYDGVDFHDRTQIGLATSEEGASWTKYDENPVLTGEAEGWDSSGEHAPFVMKDGDLYKMWYEGSNGNVRQLGYATSLDGIQWNKYEANPVLQAGPDGYDQDVAGHGSVLYEDGLFKLWYHAFGDQGAIIAYATSPDGIDWTKVGPVLWPEENIWDLYGLWGASVLKMGDTYWMWYSAGSSSYPASIGAATSPDGMNWTRVGESPVITIPDNHLGDPHVIHDGITLKMWFNNFNDGAIYYAESTDGIQWSTPALALGPGLLSPLEGWHDGMSGNVDSGGCTAFGWAADPDDRNRDVSIRILLDGQQVTTLAASEFGQDMLDNGICPGGTCRFSVNLWDFISLGEPHEITVQAYDMESDDWWNLEGTPKSLTCGPHIEAFAWTDRVSLVDWPGGVPVDITIQNPDYATTFTPDGSSNWYDLFPEVDLQAGSIITAANGTFEKVLEVSSLSGTPNPETGEISGTATPDRTFHMRTDGDHFQWPVDQDITAGLDGTWSVTIDNFLPWAWFTRGEMWEGDDDGDVTYAIWHVQQPVIEVWLAQNEIRAFDWPLDTELIFYVDEEEIGRAYPQPADWMESTWSFLNAGELALEPGMVIMVSGGGIEKSTVVQDIRITDIDLENDIVSGYAPPAASLELNSWEDSPVFRFFNTPDNETGDLETWTINYQDPSLNGVTVDVSPGDELRLFMRDEEKDSTVWQTYGPWPPLTFTVNTTDDNDEGECNEDHCSLREAINAANGNPAPDTIVFDMPGEAPFTIQPRSPLPNIDNPVTIDGTTQPGFGGSPVIELDGTYAGNWANGLVLATDNSLVKGLVINRFSDNGILLFGNGNTIQGNYIGTDVTGTTTTGPAGEDAGVPTLTVMPETCPTYEAGTEIEGFISTSADPAAPWLGESVHFLGTEVGCGSPEQNGAASLIYRYKLEFDQDVHLSSVQVSGAAFNGPDNILRVLDEDMNELAAANTFGGNSFQTPFVALNGVVGRIFYLDEFDTSSHWRFRQSFLINGPLPLGNRGNGVLVAGGATNNLIVENLISGNAANGVGIFNPGTTGNTVQENFIGTDRTGMQALGNAAPGVGIGDQANNNFIIGNLISGNKSDGVAIFNPGTNGNTLQGNNIGTEANGMGALPNAGVGVWIGDGAADTVIGGTDESVRNVISGNRWGGVSINHLQTTGSRVLGNYIGTDKNGNAVLPNGGDGVYISGSQTVVGGPESGTGNIISGNAANGISITEGASENLIQGNYIGTDVTGATTTGPAGPDVGSPTLTVMPETCPTYDPGTEIDGFVSESADPLAPWSGNSVHFLGTEVGCGSPEKIGEASLIYRYKLEFGQDVQLTSVLVSGAAFNGPDNILRVLDENMNVLGTAGTFGGNSFQAPFILLQGVVGKTFYIDEFDTSSNWRFRQSIVINGPIPLGNLGSGVMINSGASENQIVGNLISGNRSDAVALYHAGTHGNILQGNYIGTDATGTAALPNTSAAIWIGEGASNTVIGGAGEGEGNLISGNTGDAISINHAETTGTVIQGNLIGTDVTGTAAIPNLANGIVLVTGTHDNLIGGMEPGAGNVISGNLWDGIVLVDAGTSSNRVQGNFIGTDLTGMFALGNQFRGIFIGAGASDNHIGGNVISANGAAGVRLIDSGTTANQIQGNFIGTDITGLNPLGNGYIGIRLTDGASDNLIGGTEPGDGNVIAFNAAPGVGMSGEGVFGNAILSNSIFENAGLGIDLGEDDVTPNDVLDADGGPNGLQNYPVLTNVTRLAMSIKVHGLLVSSPYTTYRLEFFASDACDPSGLGEGQTYLGSATIIANRVGIGNFKITLSASVPQGTFITATATDPDGNTSEFSHCYGPVR